MGIKELILNKGWAGKTLSREETVQRLNPLIRRHHELNRSYEYAIGHLDDRDAAQQLDQLQKTARADVGKLSETVLSAGGASYNGVDLEPEDFDLGADDKAIKRKLRRLEDDFRSALAAELDEEHQIRTRAILGAVLKNSQNRLEFVERLARTAR